MYHEFSEEVRLASDWKDRWYNFIVGGFHGHETSDIRLALSIRNYQTFSDNTVIIDSDDNSAFGQISLTPIDKWELDAGVRYTHVTRAYTSVDVQNDFGALIPGSQGEQIQNLPYDLTHYAEHDESPEATLSYKPTPDFMAFLSYKQGYKGPGNNSVLNTVPVVNAAALAAQPFVHGEKAKGAEGGVKVQLFDHQLALTATGYRYNYDDEQVSFATQNSTSSILANAASLRVQGVELGGDYHPNAIRGLALSAFMNYNDTHYLKFPNAACYEGQTAAQGCSAGVQDLSGRTVSMAPQWSGNLGGSYTWNLTDRYTASVNAMVQYSSSYFADTNLDPLGRVGSYAMLDAGIRVGKSDGSWELALLCRDCTNKLYIVNGTDGSAIPPAVIEDIGRPLQIVLQLTVKPNLL
jgi:outer membrane receptor protein involved in Fe transport